MKFVVGGFVYKMRIHSITVPDFRAAIEVLKDGHALAKFSEVAVL